MTNWKDPGYIPSEHNYNKTDGTYPSNYYYANTLKSAMVEFGSFFKQFHIVRYDKNGYPKKDIPIEIKFGPRSKTFDFKKEQESGKKYYISLPNFTWNITGFNYAASRAAGLTTTRTFYNKILNLLGEQEEQFWEDICPAPYDVTINLDLHAEDMDDACQVIEQICARFTPENYLQVQEFWYFKNLRRALKLKLDSTPHEITETMGEQEKREIKVTFSFTLEMFFYKPVKNASVIKTIEARILNGDFNSTDAAEIDNNKFMDIKAVGSYIPHSQEFIDTMSSATSFVSGQIPYFDTISANDVVNIDYVVTQKEKD